MNMECLFFWSSFLMCQEKRDLRIENWVFVFLNYFQLKKTCSFVYVVLFYEFWTNFHKYNKIEENNCHEKCIQMRGNQYFWMSFLKSGYFSYQVTFFKDILLELNYIIVAFIRCWFIKSNMKIHIPICRCISDRAVATVARGYTPQAKLSVS